MAERFVPQARGSNPDRAFTEIGRVIDLNSPQPTFAPELGPFVYVMAGEFRRLRPASTGMVVTLQAPSATTLGASVALYVTAGGALRIQSQGATINGAAALTVASGTTRIVRLWSDGVSGWTTEYPGAVETGAIADGAVTTAKLATNAVTTVKITDLNVTTAKLADGAVTTIKIADANVTTAKLANLSVTEAKLDNDAVFLKNLDDPHWFDDMHLVEVLTTSGIMRTKQGNWRFTVTGGTWTLSQPLFTGAPGVIRFATNTNSTGFDLFDSISGGNPFSWQSFRSFVARVRLRTAITNITMRAGIRTPAGATAFFTYVNTGSVLLRAQTFNGAGVQTANVSTGITWAINDTYELRIDRVVDDLLFYVDGNLTNTVLSATHGLVNGDLLMVNVGWDRGTTVAECEVDYIGLRSKRI